MDELDTLPPAMPIQTLVTILLAAAAGALAATVILPAWLPGMVDSLLGAEPKAYWYLARSSAFVAYGLLWLAMIFGLMMTSKTARIWPGGPIAFDLHQHASLLGLAFALFHALVLLGDHYMAYTLAQLLIPFNGGSYRPLWVGVGQVGLYVMALVGFSFYIRKEIGRNLWRLIHFLSFALFIGSLVHGIQSGTDTGQWWSNAIYWSTGGSVLFMTFFRILSTVFAEPKPTAPARTKLGVPSAKPVKNETAG
jgi:predicted ferric reductase